MSVRSVVDIGCGAGWWLKTFQEAGVEDILGVDGEWIDEDQIQIPRERFQRRELQTDYGIDRRFDLSLSLEVAEHLEEGVGMRLVDTLCALAPVVLFSAAIPHQAGPGHVNEQWPSYWARAFQRHGYKPIDAVRPKVWDEDEVSWWYRQNMLLYADDTALEANPKLVAAAAASPESPPDLVHPEMHLEMARRGNAPWRIVMSRQVRRGFKNLFGKT